MEAWIASTDSRELYVVAGHGDTVVGGLDANVPIPERGPARATITARPGAWILRALTPRVAVDQHEVTAEVTLRHGSSIRIDAFAMWFLVGERDAVMAEQARCSALIDPFSGAFTRDFLAYHYHRLPAGCPVLAMSIDDLRDIVDVGGAPARLAAVARTVALARAEIAWPAFIVETDVIVVVLPNLSAADARALAERIRMKHLPGPSVTIAMAPLGAAGPFDPGISAATEALRRGPVGNRVIG